MSELLPRLWHHRRFNKKYSMIPDEKTDDTAITAAMATKGSIREKQSLFLDTSPA